MLLSKRGAGPLELTADNRMPPLFWNAFAGSLFITGGLIIAEWALYRTGHAFDPVAPEVTFYTYAGLIFLWLFRNRRYSLTHRWYLGALTVVLASIWFAGFLHIFYARLFPESAQELLVYLRSQYFLYPPDLAPLQEWVHSYWQGPGMPLTSGLVMLANGLILSLILGVLIPVSDSRQIRSSPHETYEEPPGTETSTFVDTH